MKTSTYIRSNNRNIINSLLDSRLVYTLIQIDFGLPSIKCTIFFLSLRKRKMFESVRIIWREKLLRVEPVCDGRGARGRDFAGSRVSGTRRCTIVGNAQNRRTFLAINRKCDPSVRESGESAAARVLPVYCVIRRFAISTPTSVFRVT